MENLEASIAVWKLSCNRREIPFEPLVASLESRLG
jgi:hypothetical protein